jgi:hypothetical protein
MTGLGLSTSSSPKVGLGIDLRAGWLKHVGLAISGASGAAIVVGAYDILRSQPDRAFALLQGWGPAFLIAILAIFAVGRIFEGLNSTVRESFSTMSAGIQSSAEAASRTASALTQLAEQGNRQVEETRRLAIYAAQEFVPMYERLDRQDELLREISQSVKGLHCVIHRETKTVECEEMGASNGS